MAGYHHYKRGSAKWEHFKGGPTSVAAITPATIEQ